MDLRTFIRYLFIYLFIYFMFSFKKLSNLSVDWNLLHISGVMPAVHTQPKL